MQGKEKAITDLLNQNSTRRTLEEEDLISNSSSGATSHSECGDVGLKALLTRANAKFIVRIILAFTNT